MPKEIPPIFSIRFHRDLFRDIAREHKQIQKELGAKISRNVAIAMLIREAIAARKEAK